MQDLSPIAWALRPLKKYASPSGRASRAEYWWFYLLYVILYIVAVVLDLMLGFGDPVDGFGGFTLVVALGLFLPMIMVGIRRLHDTGKSGWWMFIALLIHQPDLPVSCKRRIPTMIIGKKGQAPPLG